ncbi:hypothetical protein CS542_08875 [Pedobacter sp. IW39]|nr:hypothetical protein CS542_08875 [Pedobacter sp. IW39]
MLMISAAFSGNHLSLFPVKVVPAGIVAESLVPGHDAFFAISERRLVPPGLKVQGDSCGGKDQVGY